MEYKDYRTNKAITREQYISNGLERGELLVGEGCGCVVIQDRASGAYIVYCDKHAAAPDMYEALLAFDEYVSTNYPANTRLKEIAVDRMEHALAKAEGK